MRRMRHPAFGAMWAYVCTGKGRVELRSRACVTYLPLQATSGHQAAHLHTYPYPQTVPRGSSVCLAERVLLLFLVHAARRSRATNELQRAAAARERSRPRWWQGHRSIADDKKPRKLVTT